MVVASTQIPNRAMLPAYAAIIYPGRYHEEAKTALAALWDSGRIFQATARPTHVRGFGDWRRDSTEGEIHYATGIN